MTEITLQRTPGPWEAGTVKGWGRDPVITAPSWPRPLATMLVHPDRYYRHIKRTIRGEEVVTFADKTPEGEARKDAVEAEMHANAAFIVEACNNYDRLQAENARLREALRISAEALDCTADWLANDSGLDVGGTVQGIRNDAQQARAALAEKE